MADLTVEIFAEGRWNGLDFNADDLEAIKAAYVSLQGNHDVPLKFGHNDEQPLTDGQPALGWVSDVWVEGKKLLAKFSDIPEIVKTAVEKKLYRKVSVELDYDVEHKGEHYPWVLSGVALLGADIPAVNTIADLQAYMSRDRHVEPLTFSKRAVFTAISNEAFNSEVSTMPDDSMKEQLKALQAKVNIMQTELKKQTQENIELEKKNVKLSSQVTSHKELDTQRDISARRELLETKLEEMVKDGRVAPFTRDGFMTDFDGAAPDDKKTVEFAVDKLAETIEHNPAYFGREQAKERMARDEKESTLNVSEVVVERTREYMAKHGEKNFSVAKTAILHADKELAKRYVTMEG